MDSGTSPFSGRGGWRRATVVVLQRARPVQMQAMVWGEWAVYRLPSGVAGYAIALERTGFPLDLGNRAFTTCDAAMEACEELTLLIQYWEDVQAADYTPSHRLALDRVLLAAERRGQMLRARVAENLFFVLDADRLPVSVTDPVEWARWIEKERKTIGLDQVQHPSGETQQVMTVFVGLAQNPPGWGPPDLFETVVSGGEASATRTVGRANSFGAATRMHRMVCSWVRTGCKRPLPETFDEP